MSVNDITFNMRIEDDNLTVTAQRAGKVVSQLRQELLRTGATLDQTERRFNSFTGHFKSFMMTVAATRFALMDINDVFLALPKAIIKSSAEIERLTKLMEGLSTEVDKVADAKKNRAFVFNMAQNAPFEIKALTDSFIKLKAGGIDPTNGSLQALSDSVAKFGGDSQTLHRASVAIQQMAGKGVISMEELRQQLGEAIPTAMKMMAIGVGMSMRDLTAAVSKGEVESKSALERMFAVMRELNDGAAAAMMGTWNGLIQRLMTKWELFKFEIGGGDSGTGLFGSAREEIAKLIEAFDAGSFRKFGSDLSDIFLSLVQGVSSLVGWVVKFYEEIKLAGEVLFATFAASKVMALFGGIKTQLGALSLAYAQSSATFIDGKRNEVLAQQVKDLAVSQSIAKQRAALVAEETAQTAHFARMNVLYGEYSNTARVAQGVVDSGRIKGKFVSAQVLAVNEAVAASALAEANAVAVAGNAHAAKAAVLRGEIAVMDGLIAKHVQLAEAQIVTSFAGTKMAGVLGGLGSVFTALGGWVTVATAIVAAGIWAWMEYGNQAEKAADAARRAWQGMSDQKDITALDNQLENNRNAQAKLRDASGTLMDDQGNVSAEKRKQSDELIEEERKLVAARNKALENIHKNGVDDEVRATVGAITDGAAKVSAAYQVGIAAKERARDKELEHLSATIKDSTKLAAAQKKVTEDYASGLRQDAIDRRGALVAYYKSNIETLEEQSKNASGKQLDAIKESIEKSKTALNEQAGFLAKASVIGTAADKAKGKNTLEKSPLEGLLANEEAKLAQLKQHFENLRNDVTGMDAVASEVEAQVDALFARGKLKHMVDGKVVDDANNSVDVKKYKETMTERIVLEKAKPLYDELEKRANQLETLRIESDVAMNEGVKAGGGLHAINTWLSGLQTAANSAAFAGLQAQLAKTGESFEDFAARMRTNAAVLDINKLTQPMIEKTKELNSALIATDVGRREEQYRVQVDALQKQFSAYEAEVIKESQTQEAADAKLKSSRATFYGYMKALADKHALDMETPLQKMVRDWQDVYKNIKAAEVSWANGFVSELEKMLDGGEYSFKKWGLEVAKSIRSIILKDAIAKPLADAMSGLGNTVLKAFAPGSAGVAGKEDFFSDMLKKAGTGLAGFWNSIMSASDVTKGWTISLGDAASKTLADVAAMGTKMTAEQAATASLMALASAASSAAMAMGGSSGMGLLGAAQAGGYQLGTGTLGNMWSNMNGFESLDFAGEAAAFIDPFANGGIMSQFGAVSLKKYANGGIANSPQLAMFGEGSMNEAYVPLPDGRSIPVSFKGAPTGAGATSNIVTIQINVAKDGSSDSSTSGDGDRETWSRMADRVKGIVREELVTNQRPGGLLYK